MATIQIYSDESYCNKKTFRIITIIWGSPGNCAAYEDEVKAIVNKHQLILGSNFKEFHAVKLNSQNWNRHLPIYTEIFNTLFRRLNDRNLSLMTVVMSEERFDGNSRWLMEIIKKGLEDRNSIFGKLFRTLKDDDLPVVYYRINQLFPIFRYRETFGDPGDDLEFFPDSTGKVLNYSNKEFGMSGTLPFTLSFDYFDIIRMLGHSYIRAFSQTAKNLGWSGWPTSEQQLTKFKPTDSTSSYLIQSCDITSNFLFSYFRYIKGLQDEKFKLKAELIAQYIDIEKFDEIIKNSFEVSGNDIVCKAPDLWANIMAL